MNGKPHQYIFLNGPPGSGKDLAVKFILKEYPVEARHMKFSGVLKAAARAMFLVGEDLWAELEKEGSQAAKDKERAEFFGMSWRQVLIWLSEDAMKPAFGLDVFGQLMAKQLQQRTGTEFTVISDCGFAAEVHPCIKAVDPRNCHLVQLHREGCTFEGDSRSYLNPDDLPLRTSYYTLFNNHEKMMYRVQVLSRVNKILGGSRTYD